MNAFDYFFENTASLEKNFLVGKEELTFSNFYDKSLRLSNYIKEQIGEHNNVILCSPNNSFFIIAYMAILKSGNTCVPLDPMIEEDKFQYIHSQTDTKLIFAAKPAQMRLKINAHNCITELESIRLESYSASASTDEFNTEQCAEIIFTSGSTGEPKGVMLSHKNLIANTTSIVEYLKITDNDRILIVLPFYYCYGLSLLHTHLRVGGSVVFNNSFIFIGAVINDLKNNDCTGFAGVPSHFQILLRKSDTFKNTQFPALKYVTQAGGKLASVFIDEFKQAFPEVNFIVMYGQTEATARLSYLPWNEYEAHKGSIGKGIPGVTLKVINESGSDIKEGESGELIASGDNIMLGYYKDEESTKQTITNGWLYTGDIGTIDKDGYIYLTARKKEIIKVGGKRISPKEIEAVILSQKDIIDCTIEGVEDEIQGEALKATIVVNNDSTLTEKGVKDHCAQHLELYKIPQIIEIKLQMNMSATGKKIKTALHK